MAIEAPQPGSLPQRLLQDRIPHSRLAKLIAFLFFLFVAFSHQSRTQQAHLDFEDIPLEEGVQTNVQCILQDKTGFLWFATWYGLYRYDGYGFVSYRHEPDDTTSLVDNTLSVLYEDKSGILWIGSHLGLERFDPKLETFTHLTPSLSDTADSRSNAIQAICEDKYRALWVGSENGLYKFDRSTAEFTPLRHDSTDPGSIADNSVRAIYEDKDGSLWLGTGAGLDRLDAETEEFTHYAPGYSITSLCTDNAGNLWLGTTDALLEFNPTEGSFLKHRLLPNRPQDRINQVCQDVVTGSLWIGTAFGLFNFDKRSKASKSYSVERIPAVYSERSGTLWVGTNTGIRKLNRARQPFTKYPMSDVACSIKTGTEGTLWVYTLRGYKKFDTRTGQFVPYSFGKDTLAFVYNGGADLILVSPNGKPHYVDTLGVTHAPIHAGGEDLVESTSWCWKGSKGYWIGTYSGSLHFLDAKTYRGTEVKNFKQRIYYIYEDKFGLLWVSTFVGKLFCYDQKQDSLIEFVSDPKNPSSISGRQVNEIYEDTKGRLWFATSAGLNRYDRPTNTFVEFTEKSGLASNNVRGILEDGHGYLWLNTSKGISKFDPETHQCKDYDVSYGLEPAADVFYGKGCKTRNGEMYFGGAKGFTRFHPDSIKDNPFIPPIVMTSFKKFDTPLRFSGEVRLPYDQNFLSFEFAALSYISPERNQYAHMMEGLDKDWVSAGTRRYASYPGLEPGEYVFRVKGSNNDGVWNEAGTSISIIIAPPWWKAPWAYVVYSIVLLSILYVTWKMQVKRIRIAHEYQMSKFEAEKLHEIDGLKSRFFANISHEFRTPLTLILGPVKQTIEKTKEDDTRDNLRVVHKNAKRLLGLVNQLLDISKLESGTMKLHAVPWNIVQLLKALVQSFASHAERTRITLTLNSSEDEILAYIDKDKMEKILTNVLSNAFKFTPEGGRIDVGVTKDQAFVSMAVSDTGIGIPGEKISKIFDRFYQVDGGHTRAQEGTGIGLSLTKELVELHKGTIEVESTEGKGTTFTIRIPLGKDHLMPEEICDAERDTEDTRLPEEEVSFVPAETVYQEEFETQRPDIDAVTEADLSPGPSRRRLAEAEKAKKPLLLIVEDNGDVRNYIRSNVKQEYRILEAVDGEDGWNKSIDHMPDIIVSDIMMPKMDGFMLCQKLKGDQRTSHIPVILLTAKASSSDKIEGFDTGADDYVTKPFEPEELRARTRNLIEQRKRIHEHFRRHGLFELDERRITPVDQKFLQRILAVIGDHMSDPSFGVEALAAEMAVSRSLLFKKTEALVGESPIELIKRARLNRAAQLIEGRFGNIFEIAMEVGFSNPSYFAECFKKQFGSSPSHYHRSQADY